MLTQLRDRLNGETGGEKWTDQTWFTLTLALETLSANRSLPMALRELLDARAEAAWVTGMWRQGVSPADWAAECAIYQAEDDARVSAQGPCLPMVARNNSKSKSAQMELQIETA